MKKQVRTIFNFSLSIFITIFLLSVIFLHVDGWFLKLNIVEAVEPGIGLSIDKPGIRKALEVQNRYTKILMGIPDIVGYRIGISPGELAVPIGLSTGHPEVTAGTIGYRVKDLFGNVFVLSNNHIYANHNDAVINVDNALQPGPGPYDGEVDPLDAIGVLCDFEPIKFSDARKFNRYSF